MMHFSEFFKHLITGRLEQGSDYMLAVVSLFHDPHMHKTNEFQRDLVIIY